MAASTSVRQTALARSYGLTYVKAWMCRANLPSLPELLFKSTQAPKWWNQLCHRH